MIVNAGKKDVVWNYLGILFNLGSNVIFLPVMIHYVSPDMVGLCYIFASIGSIVQLFDMGFNPTISHCVTYAWKGNFNPYREYWHFFDYIIMWGSSLLTDILIGNFPGSWIMRASLRKDT